MKSRSGLIAALATCFIVLVGCQGKKPPGFSTDDPTPTPATLASETPDATEDAGTPIPAKTPDPTPDPDPTTTSPTPAPHPADAIPSEVCIPEGEYDVGETGEGALEENLDVDISNFGYLVLPYRTVPIDNSFCVGQYPFHGVVDGPWPAVGKAVAEGELADFEKNVLKPAGWRLCKAEEFIVFMAGTSNFRYPYGNNPQDPEQPVCDINPETPSLLIGGFPQCSSSGWGVHDGQVRTTWVSIKSETAKQMAASTGVDVSQLNNLSYIVAGGNARYEESFYNGDAKRWHYHPDDGGTKCYPYDDDLAPFLCRDDVPRTSAEEVAWAALRRHWYDTGDARFGIDPTICGGESARMSKRVHP